MIAGQSWTNSCGECRSCWALDKCGGCGPICIKDQQLERKRLCLGSHKLPEILANISGLDFPALTVRKRLPHLPDFIPQLANSWFPSEPALDYPVVAVGVNRVFGVGGQVKEALLSAGTVQKWLNVNPRTQVILIGFAKDQVLENIWENLDVCAAFERLGSLGVAGMTAFNFSIYHNEPRMEHLVNLKRSALTAVEAANHGISAIPHIHWGSWKDIERLAAWLRHSPSIEVVAFCMQTYKKGADWRRALDGIKYFQSLADRPLTYLLIGVTSPKRVEELLPLLPRVCLISTRPFMLAQSFRQMNEGGGDKRVPYANRAELFERNLAVILKRIDGRRSVSA